MEDDHIAKEVQDALTASTDTIRLEQLQDEDSSPLNQPVVEKEDTKKQPENPEAQKTWNVWKPEQDLQTEAPPEATDTTDFRTAVENNVAREKAQEPLDAPEQDISNTPLSDDQDPPLNNSDFEVPLSQANQAADALLGMTNNVMAVGGGYFVKLKKHKAFYEFDEIIQVIDTQNEKNVERLKLDKTDQALLRPLLAQVLRKKAKQLTPEQQLMGAAFSILIKKAQVVLEVRAENQLLEARILDIIQEEKGIQDEDIHSTDINMDSDLNDTSAMDTDEDTDSDVANATPQQQTTENFEFEALSPEPENTTGIPILDSADTPDTHSQS